MSKPPLFLHTSVCHRAVRYAVMMGWMLVGIAALGEQGASPTDASTLLAEGARLALAGRLAQAASTLQVAAQRAPGDVRVLAELAKVEGLMGRKGEAVTLFRQVVQLQSGSAAAHRDLGLALADDEQPEAALAEVDLALKADEKSAAAFLARGRILSDLKRPGEAAEAFATATRLDPQLAQAWFFWAVLATEQNDEARASDLLQKVVALEPRNAKAFSMLGRCLAHQAHEDAAREAWLKALAIDPEDAQTVYLLSHVLRKSDPPESRRLLARFQALQQQKEQTDRVSAAVSKLGNQAYAAMQHEDWAAADRDLRAAIAECGACSLLGDLRKNIGINACHQGNLRAARLELTEARRLKPADPDVEAALEWIDKQEARATPAP